MQFILLTTLRSDIDANLLKGKLESAGLEVKMNAVKSQPSRYTAEPDTFGIYVAEDKLTEAQSVLKEYHFVQPNSQSHIYPTKKLWMYVGAAFALSFVLYYIFEMISSILSEK